MLKLTCQRFLTLTTFSHASIKNKWQYFIQNVSRVQLDGGWDLIFFGGGGVIFFGRRSD